MQASPIIVGVDDAGGSAHTLEWVRDFVAGTDVEAVAVHAYAQRVDNEITTTFEQRGLAPLRDAGVRYRARTLQENPAKALIRVAEEGCCSACSEPCSRCR